MALAGEGVERRQSPLLLSHEDPDLIRQEVLSVISGNFDTLKPSTKKITE